MFIIPSKTTCFSLAFFVAGFVTRNQATYLSREQDRRGAPSHHGLRKVDQQNGMVAWWWISHDISLVGDELKLHCYHSAKQVIKIASRWLEMSWSYIAIIQLNRSSVFASERWWKSLSYRRFCGNGITLSVFVWVEFLPFEKKKRQTFLQ